MSQKDYAQGSITVLKRVLADTYILAVKTQNGHWNAQGENFIGIHQLLDKQYGELIAAVDIIAERIRAIGGSAPGSMHQITTLKRLEEVDLIEDTMSAVEILGNDHQQLRALIEDHIAILEQENDYGTIDLLTDRIREHDLNSWLLLSHIK